MARIVLDLKCIKCQTKFQRSFQERLRQSSYSEGEMLKLEETACPNNCGNEWFMIEKRHVIRKFKRRFDD